MSRSRQGRSHPEHCWRRDCCWRTVRAVWQCRQVTAPPRSPRLAGWPSPGLLRLRRALHHPRCQSRIATLGRLFGPASSFGLPRQPFGLQSLPICVEGLFCFLVIGRGLRRGLPEEVVRLLRCLRLGMPSHCLSSLSPVIRSPPVPAASWCSAYSRIGLLRLDRSIRTRLNSSGPASRSRLRTALSSAVVVASPMRSIASPAILRARCF